METKSEKHRLLDRPRWLFDTEAGLACGLGWQRSLHGCLRGMIDETVRPKMHPEVEHLRKLPIAEKLRVVEELWDDIGQSDESFPLPAWHRAEVDRRAADLDADPAMAIDRDELWRRVDTRNG
jgi:putative addiction module component (TIGR02574 family)